MLFDKEMFGYDSHILCVFSYVQPEGSAWYNKQDTTNGVELPLHTLLSVLEKHSDASTLVFGDLNSRTGRNRDYLTDYIICFVEGDDNLRDFFIKI